MEKKRKKNGSLEHVERQIVLLFLFVVVVVYSYFDFDFCFTYAFFCCCCFFLKKSVKNFTKRSQSLNAVNQFSS